MDLYVASRQSLQALELCLKYNIKITEDMAEKLSAANANAVDGGGGVSGGEDKIKILNKIAEVAYQQVKSLNYSTVLERSESTLLDSHWYCIGNVTLV